MKKLWATIWLVVYFTVSSGFVVNLHYCMGKPAGVELGTSSASDCGKCGMPLKAKKSCCEDEVKVIKLQQDQPAATFAIFHFGFNAALPVQPAFYLSNVQQAMRHLTPPAHAPPLLGKQDIYLTNCVFRI